MDRKKIKIQNISEKRNEIEVSKAKKDVDQQRREKEMTFADKEEETMQRKMQGKRKEMTNGCCRKR